VAVAGSGQVTAAWDGADDPDEAGSLAGPLTGGVLAAALALGLGVAPDEHAPMMIIDATRSAPRRFEARTVTRNLLLATLGRGH